MYKKNNQKSEKHIDLFGSNMYTSLTILEALYNFNFFFRIEVLKMIRKMWMKSKDKTNVITLLGCLLCVILIFAGVNSMIIMIVLAVLLLYMGIYSLIEKKMPLRKDYSNITDPEAYSVAFGKCELLLSAFIFLMGLWSFFPQVLPAAEKYFWDIFLFGLIGLFIYAYAVYKKYKK